MPTSSARASIASLAFLCTTVTLFGCTQPGGSTPFLTSRGQLVQGPSTSPPGSVPGVAGPFDGIYQGPSTAIFTGGGRCLTNQSVTDFQVRGNVADWSGYTGAIDPDGSVQMHRGFEFLTGRFHGNRFVGRLETGAYGRGPSCVFNFDLRRVAA